ncbi:hypothetical protein IWW46_001766 [Coemansia sp. RSA 2440]|nr:hypothetical protein IWW46_001766 [Coemansia sp. RSA 2440]
MYFHFLGFMFLLCASVLGNTEIRHFRPIVDGQKAHCSHKLPATILIAPFTQTDTVTIASLESTKHNRQDKEHWYCLRNLEPGLSHELRISYAATTPSRFIIDIFSSSEVQQLYNLTNEQVLLGQEDAAEQIMYARVTVSYAGASHIQGLENDDIPYIFTLEKHILGLPVQALWLIAVIVAVVALSLLVVTPKLQAVINSVLSEPAKAQKED